MKKFLHILLAVAVLLVCTSATLKKDKKSAKETKVKEAPLVQAEVYGFGFAASFTDSVAFYTDIQLLDSASLVNKSYLNMRYDYSYQLKYYLQDNLQKSDHVCMIFFNTKLKKLQKEYDKLLNKYRKAGTGLRQIPITDFKFSKPE